MTRDQAIEKATSTLCPAWAPSAAVTFVDSLIALDILKVEKEYTVLDLAREALRVQRFETVDRGAAMLAPQGIELVLNAIKCMGLEIVKK